MTQKTWTRLVTVVLGLVLLGAWTADIPIGYYQFKKKCEQEGGLRTFGRVEVGVGWWANSEPEAKGIVAQYPSVPFARYRAKDGAWIEVRYKGGNPGWHESFSFSRVLDAVEPRYHWISADYVSVPDSIRLRKLVDTLNDTLSGQPILQTTHFSFSWTTPEKTLLGRSDTVVCPIYKEERSAIQSFLNSFKE